MSLTPYSPPAVTASGRVVNITDGQGQNDQGQWVKGKNVAYQLDSGQAGSVFVPLSMFNPDMVKACVAAAAQNLADSLNITF